MRGAPGDRRSYRDPFTGDGVRQVTGERLRGTPGNQSARSRERNVQAMGGRGYAFAARRGAMLAPPPSGSQTVWREIPDIINEGFELMERGESIRSVVMY